MFFKFKNHSEVGSTTSSKSNPPEALPPVDNLIAEYTVKINHLEQENSLLKAQLQEYRKLQGDLTDSINEILTIQQASKIITEHLNYDKIGSALLQLCREVINTTEGNIFLSRPEGWAAVFQMGNTDFTLVFENMLEEGIIEWILTQNQTIVIPLHELIVYDQLETKEGNLLISPLQVGKKRLGILMLLSPRNEEDFTRRDLQLVGILALQAAIAIQYTRMYKKLEKAHLELEHSQASLLNAVKLATVGEVAGGVAHEINNPLQIIMGKLQMARMGKDVPEALDVIEMQSMRIATIVRGLLTLARQENRGSSEQIIIHQVIHETVDLIRSQMEKRGIHIEVNLEKSLPVLWGNSVYWQQILLNFMLNAKKRMITGGKFTITARNQSKDTVVIEFHDTGLPIAPEIIKNLTTPFSHKDSSLETDAHFGLMMSAQMIIEVGGELAIDTSSPEGNHITITIPVKSGEELRNELVDATNFH